MGQGNEFPFCLLEGDFLVKKKKPWPPSKSRDQIMIFMPWRGPLYKSEVKGVPYKTQGGIRCAFWNASLIFNFPLSSRRQNTERKAICYIFMASEVEEWGRWGDRVQGVFLSCYYCLVLTSVSLVTFPGCLLLVWSKARGAGVQPEVALPRWLVEVRWVERKGSRGGGRRELFFQPLVHLVSDGPSGYRWASLPINKGGFCE